MKSIYYNLRGFLAVLLLAVNMIVWAIIILPFAFFGRILPGKAMMKFALLLPTYWTLINKWILKMNTVGKWDVQGAGLLNQKGWYLIIANHESWIDIPVLGSVFTQKIPLIKFFMKKQLLWQLPIAGIDCFLLGYPILSRGSRVEIRKNPALRDKDIQSTQKACKKFKEFPTTLMNFLEGTRFTEEKRIRQESPYRHLLKPKAAGAAIVLTEMSNKLDGIVNTTIHYDAKKHSLWYFLCGRINKVYVRYEVIPVTSEIIGNYYDDRKYRKNFQSWLNLLWTEKDKIIESLIQSYEKNH